MKELHINELVELAPTELGTSDWLTIDQARIDQFAESTGDDQWIHVDRERAADGPFGTTIAHGFLTLSLFPVLLREVWKLEGASMGINYGIEKVRFLAPVPVDNRVRMKGAIARADERPDGSVQVTFDLTFELEGSERPALVAQTIGLYRA